MSYYRKSAVRVFFELPLSIEFGVADSGDIFRGHHWRLGFSSC